MTRRSLLSLPTLVLTLLLLLPLAPARAQTSFTHQGRLVINGVAVTGQYDFQFTLYTAASGGSQVGAINKLNVAVSSGNYSVTLDYGGGTWTTPPLYLQIAYRKSGTSTWVPISGRTQYTVRFARAALSAMGLQGRTVSATAPGSGQVLTWNGTQWAPASDVGGTAYSAGAGLTLAGGVFSIATGGVAAAMLASNAVTNAKIANGAVTPAKVAWPFQYSGSSDNILFDLTNGGTGYAFRGTGGQAGVVGVSSGGYGIIGNSTSNQGVHGESPSGIGVYGSSSSGVGVHGVSNVNFGVRGESMASWGVYGRSANNVGVWGQSQSSYGTHGRSTDNDGVNGYSVNGYGVVGSSDNSYAGYFYGALYAQSASASIKAFEIDHPLDPANKYLSHSCVESNERKNVYDGTVTTDVNGDATVTLPAWFEALNGDFRYQLTVIGQFAQAIISREIAHGQFSIKTDKPGVKVSWQVTGVRHDPVALANPLQVERMKPDAERGTLLNPQAYGQPDTLTPARRLPATGKR